MAKKSFKKGVDSLIQPTGKNENKSKARTAEKKSTPKSNPKSTSTKDDKFVIDLGSKLTIDKMPDVKQKLLEAMQENNKIVLHSKNVEDIDLSFIQMVIAIEKAFESKKKKLELDLNIPENVAQLLINSGFSSFLEK